MGTAVVRAGIDASAISNHASTNYGTSKALYLQSGATIAYAYLYFKNPAPRGATIQSATLRVYGKGAWGGGAIAITAQRVAASWKVSQLNYTNRPGVTGATVTVTQPNASDATEWDFNVAALTQTVTSGAADYGLRLSIVSTTQRQLYALDASDFQPELTVTWSDAPSTPHTLNPAGGHAVSVSKPTLSFDYVDVSGSVTLAAVQVQIDPAANWGAPAFDSGAVATSDPELDLSTTAYAGLAADATTQWRVRVQDGAGLWSSWSDAATFVRKIAGTLTLDNPALSPNNFVSEWTPPILWTFTGRTQRQYRVTIALDATPSVFVWDSGTRNGTASAITVPSGKITRDNTLYRITLDVRDTIDRTSTPGDPSYSRIVRSFTFAQDNTVDPPTALSVTQDWEDRAWATVHWSRATAPDSWNVLRDGRVVASGLLPGDTFDVGTSYEYVDKDGAGNVNHVWSVQAVVNGKTSAANPTITARLTSLAIWLTDTISNRLCPILNVENPTFEMPDSAAEFTPIGGDHVVRITQAQRGLQGSLSGLIIDFGGQVAPVWIANLLWMKQRPQLALRLTIGEQSFRVLIGNVVIAPTQVGGSTNRAVAFDFWSLDGVDG